jgi:phosphatidylserine decarboxylase
MKFHKEGYPTLILTILFAAGLILFIHWFFFDITLLRYSAYVLSVFLMVVVLQFFRSPIRNTSGEESSVISPADGKVVVIEEVEESEYFKDKRLQISIFMSPVNVHVNRFPVSGEVKYVKYHPGKYLVAWHPKSSTDNERTTIVVEREGGVNVMFRQIAGALARRIVYYCREGEQATQGAEFGFIKFGSRVDVFLPLDAKVNVKLNEKVRGGETVIAFLS